MADANFILHKGQKIYYMDFSNLTDKETIFEKIEEYNKYIFSQQEHSVLALTNLGKMFFNKEVYDRFNEFVLSNKKYIKKSAVIGLDKLIKIMFSGVLKITKRDLRAFNKKEEALEFLVKKDYQTSF